MGSPIQDGLAAVVLRAPAGYGKTTVAAQWFRDAEPRRSIWVGLDVDDDDPAGLWHAIAAGAARCGLESTPQRGTVRDATIIPLIDAIATSPDDWMLVLDDAQVLTRDDTLRSVDWFLSRIPENLVVVLATRTSLDLPILDRLRSRGTAVEITADMLRLDRDQTGALLRSSDRLDLADRDVARIHEMTGGWPAAVSLTGSALGRGLPIERLSAAGTHGIDALVREGLAGGSPEDAESLRRLAVLERFTPDIVDSVVGDARAWDLAMDVAERTGLIAVLDDEGRWWRMHQLVREHLLGELERRSPQTHRELHRKAAARFEVENDLDQALRHLIAAQDHGAITDMLSNLRPNAILPREALVLRWLDSIPTTISTGDARVDFWEALVSAQAGDRSRRDRAIARGRLAAGSGPIDDFSSWDDAEDFIRAAVCFDDVNGTLRACERFLDRHGADEPGSPLARVHVVTARLQRASLLYVAGRPAEALPALDELDAGPEVHSSLRILVAAYRALCRLELGETEAAAHEFDLGAAVSAAGDSGPFHLPVTVALARLQTETGDPASGRETAGAELRLALLSPSAALFAPQILIEVARAEVALGGRAAASVALTQAEDLCIGMTDAGALPRRIAQLRAVCGDAVAPAHVGLTSRELDVLLLLPTELSAADIAAELFISPNTVRTHLKAIYRKLAATSRAEVVRAARRAGLIG